MDYFKALVAKLKGELVTQLNLLATAALLWFVAQPSAPLADILAYLPASTHGAATFAIPVLWGIVVQFAIELLKKRSASDAVAGAVDGQPVPEGDVPLNDAPLESAG